MPNLRSCLQSLPNFPGVNSLTCCNTRNCFSSRLFGYFACLGPFCCLAAGSIMSVALIVVLCAFSLLFSWPILGVTLTWGCSPNHNMSFWKILSTLEDVLSFLVSLLSLFSIWAAVQFLTLDINYVFAQKNEQAGFGQFFILTAACQTLQVVQVPSTWLSGLLFTSGEYLFPLGSASIFFAPFWEVVKVFLCIPISDWFLIKMKCTVFPSK